MFARYENYNTHDEMAEGFESNLSYNRTEKTIGVTYKVKLSFIFYLKADYQFISNELNPEESTQMNLGVAVWF